MGTMFLPLRRYADFEGRSRRQEFWLWQLFNYLIGMALTVALIALVVPAIMRVQEQGGITPGYGPYSYSDTTSSYSFEGNIDLDLLMQEIGTGTFLVLGLMSLWSLFLFIPSLAVAIRRLHDTDRSGWWLFISMVPLVGFIILLVFLCSDGTRGANRFGSDPKGGYGGGYPPPYPGDRRT